jgi:hypothetical protein
LIIVAIFMGVFGVFTLLAGVGVGLLAISGLIFWRIQRRRNMLMAAVKKAIDTLKTQVQV